MALETAMMDVRKARRAMRLREENDPDTVARTLETILKEVIAMKSTDTKGPFGKAALKELEQIRNDLIAQQINAGKKSNIILGKYSLVIDELRSIQTDDVNEKDSVTDVINTAFGSIASSIPSAQAITSALITANPFLGYGAKIIFDLFSSNKERRIEAQRLREQQMKEFADRARNLQRELDNLDKQEEVLDKQDDLLDRQNTEVDQCAMDCTENEVLASLLEDVHEEMHKLYLVWADEEQRIKIEQELEKEETLEDEILEQQEKTNENLEKLISSNDEMVDLERMRDDQTEFAQREYELETRADNLAPEAKMNENKSGSLLGGLGFLESLGLKELFTTGLGTFFGVGAATGGMLGMIGSILAAVGRFALRLPKVALFVAAINGVYEFIDGFLNAEPPELKEGEENREPTLFERVKSGTDSFTEWYKSFSENLAEKVSKSYEEDSKAYLEYVDRIKNSFSEGLDRFTNSIEEDIRSMFNSLSDWWKNFNPLSDFWSWITTSSWDAKRNLEIKRQEQEIEQRYEELGIIRNTDSFIDRLFNTGSAMGAVNNAYLKTANANALMGNEPSIENVNLTVYETVPATNEVELTVYETATETSLERLLNLMEEQKRENIITSENSIINLTPINNVTNNSVNQNTVQPRMSSTQNREPAYRRLMSPTQSLTH